MNSTKNRRVLQHLPANLFVAFLLLMLLSANLFGQAGATGTILGTVVDSTGAVVPGATITITNTATGVSTGAKSSSSGEYNAPGLLPGEYQVSVEAPGFQRSVLKGITLNVTQQVRSDISLSSGSVSETVQVQANAVSLNTDDSSISQEVTQRQVNDLPLNGRNFLDLLFIGAGAVQTIGEQGGLRPGAGGAISINGQRATSNNYTLDGLTNVDAALGQPAVILSIDAIQEFTDQSANYGAQYGYSANQVNLLTKSGTNSLHGGLYEFNRNNAYDATGPLLDSLPVLRQNQFGYTLGGPLSIPRIYNGKDRTFFFANYEGWRINQGSETHANVPSPANLAGYFATAVNDPTTGMAFAGCVANGVTYTSCIPASRNSRLANLAVTKFFPAPNSTSPQGNFVVSAANPSIQDQQDYRIDQDLRRYGKLFGRGTVGSFNVTSATGVDVPIGNTQFQESASTYEIGHTISLGQSIINQAHYGHLELTNNSGGYAADPADVTALGLTGVFTGLSPLQRTYPDIQFANSQYSTVGGNSNYTADHQISNDFGDSLTIVRGKHTIATGIEFLKYHLDRNVANSFLGNPYIFSDFATGNNIGDFLLGYYSEADVFQPGPSSSTNTGAAGSPYTYNFTYAAPYVQDDWKVRRNLSLNLGIRYDYRTVPYESNDHYAWRDPQNAAGGLCFADKSLLTNGVAPAGNTFYRYCGSRSPGSSNKTPFAPRLGFAFTADAKTVIRGGYGIYFDSIEAREYDGGNAIYPYVSRGAYKQTGSTLPLQTTDTLFPVFAGGEVTPAEDSFLAVMPSPTPRSPYVEQYSFSVQRQLSSATTLDINYVGNRGVKLLARNNIAQTYAPDSAAACQANPALANCQVTNRKPYSQFGTYIEDQFAGNSNYNAGNVKLEHRSSDFALTAIYTWAKSLDNKSAAAAAGNTNGGWQGFLDNHNPQKDYGASDFNVTNRFVTSFVYALPVGKGKKYANSPNKALNAVVGGWQVNGVFNTQNGFPFSTSATDGCATCAGGPAGVGALQIGAANRANQVGNPHPSGFHSTHTNYFNKAAFAQPGDYTFGNSGRNVLKLPAYYNLDSSIFKAFNLTERVNFVFRLETFNTLNNAQYGLDPGNLTQENSLNGGFPIGNINSPQYGVITTARQGRVLQLGGKLNF